MRIRAHLHAGHVGELEIIGDEGREPLGAATEDLAERVEEAHTIPLVAQRRRRGARARCGELGDETGQGLDDPAGERSAQRGALGEHGAHVADVERIRHVRVAGAGRKTT